MFNIIVGSIVIGYAGITLVNTVKNNSKSPCHSCALKDTCQKTECDIEWIDTFAATSNSHN